MNDLCPIHVKRIIAPVVVTASGSTTEEVLAYLLKTQPAWVVEKGWLTLEDVCDALEWACVKMQVLTRDEFGVYWAV